MRIRIKSRAALKSIGVEELEGQRSKSTCDPRCIPFGGRILLVETSILYRDRFDIRTCLRHTKCGKMEEDAEILARNPLPGHVLESHVAEIIGDCRRSAGSCESCHLSVRKAIYGSLCRACGGVVVPLFSEEEKRVKYAESAGAAAKRSGKQRRVRNALDTANAKTAYEAQAAHNKAEALLLDKQYGRVRTRRRAAGRGPRSGTS